MWGCQRPRLLSPEAILQWADRASQMLLESLGMSSTGPALSLDPRVQSETLSDRRREDSLQRYSGRDRPRSLSPVTGLRGNPGDVRSPVPRKSPVLCGPLGGGRGQDWLLPVHACFPGLSDPAVQLGAGGLTLSQCQRSDTKVSSALVPAGGCPTSLLAPSVPGSPRRSLAYGHSTPASVCVVT